MAETGGVTRAAQRLHLTQSAVSMQIKRLEDSLGAALLSRQGRGVTLSRKGEELLASARRFVALNDEILAQMAAPEPAGELVLGVPHDIVYPHVPHILRAFNERHPNVKLQLFSSLTAVLLEKYEAGDVDIILTTEQGVRPGGETLERRQLTWVGAVGGRAWRKSPVPLAFERRCAFRKLTQTSLEEAGAEWEWAVETEHLDAAIATIAADLAICTVLRGAHPHSLSEIDHEGALPELPELCINLYAGAALSEPLIGKLAELIRAQFAPKPHRHRAA